MIRTIDFDRERSLEYVDKYNNKLSKINGLNKINIFVGENNSAKSRMMRKILSSVDVNYYDDVILEMGLIDDEKNYKRRIISNMDTISPSISKKLQNKISHLQNYSLLQFYEETYEIVCCIESFEKDKVDIHHLNTIKQSLNNYLNIFHKKNEYGSSYQLNNTNSCYVPILRGIENFEKFFGELDGLENIKMTLKENQSLLKYVNQSKKIYKNKVSKIYKIQENVIFTAEELYNEITDKLLGTEDQRMFINEFQDFISKNFYNGVKFSINPYKKGSYLNIKISNSTDRALYNMGEGVKQIIILLYKMFEQRDKEMLFFIEEPEINLHPGFQRKLIEVFQNKMFEKHQIFITTHSNHILDLSIESSNISLYKFKNVDSSNSNFSVEKVQNRDLSILEELGVNNSSVFLSNCTIWVEGISDRLYIKKYLELLFKKNNINQYKEDINYSFVEYGGNNITHWSFLDTDDDDTINAMYLNNNIFLICDNDNTKEHGKVWERKQKLNSILSDNFFELKSREIENLISLNILENMLKKDNNITNLTLKKGKSKKNNEAPYANPIKKIQDFIEETYELKKTYKTSEGYLKDKVSFARKIIEEMNDYDGLSVEAKELTEKIFNFIKENN